MSKPMSAAEAFPVAYGIEEECGMLLNQAGELKEPGEMVEGIGDYLPDGQLAAKVGHKHFLFSGHLYYPQDMREPAKSNLERVTPECDTPKEGAIYDKAGQKMTELVVQNYLEDLADRMGEDVDLRWHRRVVDGEGSRKGCHDNFGIAHGSRLFEPLTTTGRNLPPAVLEHISSRSLVTGAGYATGYGQRFAQKIGGLEKVMGYGFRGNMYRTTDQDGGIRLEVRCSDVNISDWAVQMRLGSMGLVLALCQTPLADRINNDAEWMEAKMGVDDAVINRAKTTNVMNLTPDGQLTLNGYQLDAVDFEQRVAEYAMDLLPGFLDVMPDEYFHLAHELHEYCEDLKKVHAGESDISLLADRADWAAKFSYIIRDMERDDDFGIQRQLNDFTAQAKDLRYDYMGFKTRDGTAQRPIYGMGYKLRAKGAFRMILPERPIQKAMHEPPANTRAYARTAIARRYEIAHYDWSLIHVARRDNNVRRLGFEDVRKTDIHPSIIEELDDVAIRRQS